MSILSSVTKMDSHTNIGGKKTLRFLKSPKYTFGCVPGYQKIQIFISILNNVVEICEVPYPRKHTSLNYITIPSRCMTENIKKKLLVSSIAPYPLGLSHT